MNNLNHFVVVALVKHLMHGVDHEGMKMKIMIKTKIHQQLQMVLRLLGHLEVDKQDEEAVLLVLVVVAVVVVEEGLRWKIVLSQMISGVILMIDLVYKYC